MPTFPRPRFARPFAYAFGAVALMSVAASARAQHDTPAAFDLTVTASAGSVFHRFSEALHNGRSIPLLPAEGRTQDFRARQSLDQLSGAVKIALGDTISLYRELRWMGLSETAVTGSSTLGDTVAVTLEVIDASTRRRVALIDSVGVMQNSDGAVVTFGTQPPFALIRYIVGPGVRTTRVMLRRRCVVSSSLPSTIDAATVEAEPSSKVMSDPEVVALSRRFGKGLEQRDPSMLAAACHGNVGLKVRPVGSGGRLGLSFPNAPVEGVTTIASYDADGTLLYINMVADHSPGGRCTVELTPPVGAQFLALYHDNLLVAAASVPTVAEATKRTGGRR